jgi:hypothetical protein
MVAATSNARGAGTPDTIRPDDVALLSRPASRVDIHELLLLIEALAGVPTVLLFASRYGPRRAGRYAAGMMASCAAQHLLVAIVRRRVGKERWTVADLLTLSRSTTAAVLAGVSTSGVRDRTGPAGWLTCLSTLVVGSLTDWFDGPLARRAGPTRLGGVMDIEADSWLSLWSAVEAVRCAGLPRLCLLPPAMHYIHPILDLWERKLPEGNPLWFSRAPGIAQGALIGLALVPVLRDRHLRVLRRVAVPVSGLQTLVMLTLLLQRLARMGLPRRAVSPKAYEPVAHRALVAV